MSRKRQYTQATMTLWTAIWFFVLLDIVDTLTLPFSVRLTRCKASWRLSSREHQEQPFGINYRKHESSQEEPENLLRRRRSLLSRRGMLTQAAAWTTAAAAVGTTSSPKALAFEPTKIELNVETDYLVQLLNYFDGDMRKVLGAAVRSPYTKVQIDPPPSFNNQARDAILRALYSYEAPDDYLEQAKWLRIEEQEYSLLRALTKKRYKVALAGGSGNDAASYSVQTSLSLSGLEVGVVGLLLSYPIAYLAYQYEGFREEQNVRVKKAKLEANRVVAAAKRNQPGTKGGRPKPKKESKTENAPKLMTVTLKTTTAPTGTSNIQSNQLPVPPQKAVAAATPVSAPVTVDPSQQAFVDPSSAPPTRDTPNWIDTAETSTTERGTMDAYAEQYAAMVAASKKQTDV